MERDDPTPPGPGAPNGDSSFTLDDALLARRKSANARRLATSQIPFLRGLGFGVLGAIALLQGLRTDAPFGQTAGLVGLNLGYAALAWALLRFGYGRSGRLDLSLLLFHLDVPVWLANLYVLEQGNLFFAYFLLVRVVDQVGSAFGVRCTSAGWSRSATLATRSGSPGTSRRARCGPTA